MESFKIAEYSVFDSAQENPIQKPVSLKGLFSHILLFDDHIGIGWGTTGWGIGRFAN